MDFWTALGVLDLQNNSDLTKDFVHRSYLQKLDALPAGSSADDRKQLRDACEVLQKHLPDETPAMMFDAPPTLGLPAVVDAQPLFDPLPAPVRDASAAASADANAAATPSTVTAPPTPTAPAAAAPAAAAPLTAPAAAAPATAPTAAAPLTAPAAAAPATAPTAPTAPAATTPVATAATPSATAPAVTAAAATASATATAPGEAARPAPRVWIPGESTLGVKLSVPDLVEKLLLLLQAEEIDSAREMAANWREDMSAPRPTDDDIARWSVTRELLAIAPAVPPAVTVAIANGIAANDVSTARQPLVDFRRSNADAAAKAHGEIQRNAPTIAKYIGNALHNPPPVQYFQNYQNYSTPPSISSGSGFSYRWITIPIALVLFIVRMAMSSSSSSSYSSDYSYNNDFNSQYDLDSETRRKLLEDLENTQYKPPTQPEYPPPPEAPGSVADPSDKEEVWSEIYTSISAFQYDGVSTYPQKEQINAFEEAALAQDCKNMRTHLALAEEQPAGTGRLSHFADEHLRALRERVDIVCPDKASKKKTRKKPAAVVAPAPAATDD